MEELGGCDLREVRIPSVDRDGSIAYMPRSTPRKAFQLKERLLTLAAQKRQAAGPNNANRFAQRFCSSASVAEASYEAEGASNAFPSRPLSLLLPKRPLHPLPAHATSSEASQAGDEARNESLSPPSRPMLLPLRRAAQLQQQWLETGPSRGGRAALYRLPPPGKTFRVREPTTELGLTPRGKRRKRRKTKNPSKSNHRQTKSER
jgi:hypothetical protein